MLQKYILSEQMISITRLQTENLPAIEYPNGGEIGIYEPTTNTFGVYGADGQTQTFYKPTSPTYFEREVEDVVNRGGSIINPLIVDEARSRIMNYICPVCGFTELHKNPEHLGPFEICPSCRFQFGVSDRDKGFTYDQWRQKWIEGGMIWDKGESQPPSDWNPKQQLQNIGIKLS